MKKKMVLSTFLLVLVAVSTSWADIHQNMSPNKDPVPGIFPKKAPVIQSAFQKPPVNPLYRHLLIIAGVFFGNIQGEREVRLGHYSLETAQWSMEQVGAYIPSNALAGKRYPVSIWNKTTKKVISNELDFLLKIMVRPPPAAQGAAHTLLVLDAGSQNIGGSQGSRKVKFGNAEAQVVSWSSHSVTVRVPGIAPGQYNGWIEENGEVVSYEFQFRVL